MQPPSLHSNFFSSLKQVEKRLKLEHPSHGSGSSSQVVPQSNYKFTSTESLINSPLHLHFDQTNSHNSNNSTRQESSISEAPQAFLSLSPQFPQTQQNPPQLDHLKRAGDQETDNIDEVQTLMQLLGLKVNSQVGKETDDFDKCCQCNCEGGFYEKIVGVKGPKCEKEVERMEGWIKYFSRNSVGEEEPLRLAYLLLGKASFLGSDSDFGGLEFPSTVDEFLKNEPPNE